MRQHYRRWLRLLPLALLAGLVAPGTWWRDQPLPPGAPAVLSVTPLQLDQPEHWPAELTLAGSWHIASEHQGFGGYSALMALPGDRLLAYSDRRDFLEFAMPGAVTSPVRIEPVPQDPAERYMSWDFEGATRDPQTGRRWLSVEGANAIRRLDAQGDSDGLVYPHAMQHWPGNQGAEGMVRLSDGRFIVLAEGSPGSEPPVSEGLLFAGDPVGGAEAIAFQFPRQGRYRPTDLAALPDGRVIILQRQITPGLPPFGAMLALADPATIRPGRPWPWQVLAPLSPPMPRENYEGLAITPAPGGGHYIWIISDDNQASLQRTLLLKLHWAG